MIVVAIIAVLAAVAVYGVRNYVRSARTAEAYNMIASIKAGQESYRSETYQYLDVSGDSWDNMAPGSTGPGKRDFAYDPKDTVVASFASLGVRPSSPVVFSYAVRAGGASENVAQPTPNSSLLPTSAPGPWYVVQAVGDQDGDGQYSYFVGSSFTDEIASFDEKE